MPDLMTLIEADEFRDEFVKASKFLSEQIKRQLAEFRLEVLATMRRELDAHVGRLFDKLLATLKAMPTPKVVVPDSAIAVNVKQTLQIPARKSRVEKSIVYGQTGRPERIVEETTESDAKGE